MERLDYCDDPAGRIEATPDSRLTDLDAVLTGIVYADGERGRQRPVAVPEQGTGACRTHTHGAER